MMKKLLLLMLSFLGLGGLAAEKPNIIIIYADDMGHGDISVMNPDSKIPTPHLDKLATTALRFDDGHSSSGICTPSRYALLTGNYHWRRMHGIVNSFGASVFEKNEMTLPRMLKQQGYKTACIGKWHLGFDWKAIMIDPKAKVKSGKKSAYSPKAFDWSKPIPGGPLSIGFDYYFGDGVINFPPYCWIENDRVTETPTVMLDLKGTKPPEGGWECRPGPAVKDWDHYAVLPTLTDKTLDYLDQQKKDEAFFLYFALPGPHAPIIPNKEFIGKSQAGPYGDFVYQIDWITGQVVNKLKEKGLYENTLLIFTADNGPEHYAYTRATKFKHYSPGKLRGLKRDVYEGGHRVPFFISWPNKIKAATTNETISQVDLMATIAKITGASLKENEAVDSYNMLNILMGEKAQNAVREATVQNTFENQFAIRRGDWLFIDANTGHRSRVSADYLAKHGFHPINKKAPGLLYNLKDDLAQKNNLYDQNPEIVKELKALLTKYRESKRSAPLLD
ncbi:arylsulfatase A precursor [Lentisphaera araneosa HTCC2155]|uniref:Arylsulfatase A n=1 Tax=Lentisphaera araneosa HTCC2155 TaxID=313628 RepID=A6DT78_9BACT|nr:arylsulfatase [Lentisphaera araneosa]EDM25151.1 arylsulfatase A precursor [Lentisphaera araneosa HTCC2155]